MPTSYQLHQAYHESSYSHKVSVDISTNDSKVISTSEMGDAVISKLNELI